MFLLQSLFPFLLQSLFQLKKTVNMNWNNMNWKLSSPLPLSAHQPTWIENYYHPLPLSAHQVVVEQLGFKQLPIHNQKVKEFYVENHNFKPISLEKLPANIDNERERESEIERVLPGNELSIEAPRKEAGSEPDKNHKIDCFSACTILARFRNSEPATRDIGSAREREIPALGWRRVKGRMCFGHMVECVLGIGLRFDKKAKDIYVIFHFPPDQELIPKSVWFVGNRIGIHRKFQNCPFYYFSYYQKLSSRLTLHFIIQMHS